MSTLQLEFALLLRNGLIRTSLGVAVLLLLLALWAGIDHQSRWLRAATAARAAAEQQLLLEQQNVRAHRQEGFYAPGAPDAQLMDVTLPASPGVLLALGDSIHRPVTGTLRTSTRSDELFKNSETGSALTSWLGTLDLTWIAVVLWPLLVIVLMYDVLAGERDGDRLGLLRAQSRSLSRLLARRCSVRLSLPMMLVAVAALTAAVLGTPLARVLPWWALTSLYLLFWGLLAALVSVRARSSQLASVTLLALWLGFVVALPALLRLGMETLAPVPSRLQQVVAIRSAELGLEQRTAELLDRYLLDHPELAGASTGSFSRDYFLAQQETETRLAPLITTYTKARQRQLWLSKNTSWLSPPLLVHAALLHVAGTDGDRHAAFVRQAIGFSGLWRQHLRRALFANQPLSVSALKALPRFHFVEPKSVAAPLAPAFAYLGALSCVLAMILALQLRHRELR